MDTRALGKDGPQVGEVGLALAWDKGTEALIGPAKERGCSFFLIENHDKTLVELAKAHPDVYFGFHIAMAGILAVLRGEEKAAFGVNVREGGLPEVAKKPEMKFVFTHYNLIYQQPSIDLMPGAKAAGLGVVAADVLGGGALEGPVGHTPPGAIVEKYKFLIKPNHTLSQAAIQFVLANEYISCALARAETVKDVEEVLSAPDAEPFTIGELEQVFETWAGRCDK